MVKENENSVTARLGEGQRIGLIVVLITALSGGVASADDSAQLAIDTALMWHSKYITRGRDNLDDGGSFSPEINLTYGNNYTSAWFTIGDSVNYREMNLSIGHIVSAGPMELDIGYTWLWFDHESTDDHELTAVASWQSLAWLSVEADYVYATNANGGALDMVVRGEFPGHGFTLSPYALAGFDFSFASDQYDGISHIEIGAEGVLPLGENTELSIYAAHSFAQTDIDRDGLGDLSWVGVGLHFNLQ